MDEMFLDFPTIVFFSDEISGLPSIRSSSRNTLLRHVVIRKRLELLDRARIQVGSLPSK